MSDKKLKIVACVVLFQPSRENINNVLEYAPLFDRVYAMDNSDRPDEVLLKDFCSSNISVISMGGNQGIAKALRLGVENAIADNADFCLTMDQDSAFPVERIQEIKEYLTRPDIDDYGIIGLNINSDDKEKRLVSSKLLPTSGNFINLRNYKNIGGFRDELFIDSVDYDLNHQFYMAGKKLAYINDISLRHTVGNPVKRRFFFKTVLVSNHSPLRCYYRFRNNYYLYKTDKKFYRTCRYMDFKRFVQILLFEQDKREKIKMIRLGVRHAKQNKLGKLIQGEN